MSQPTNAHDCEAPRAVYHSWAADLLAAADRERDQGVAMLRDLVARGAFVARCPGRPTSSAEVTP